MLGAAAASGQNVGAKMREMALLWRIGGARAGLVLAISLVALALPKAAIAERWRQPIDPTYPHITAQSDWYPSETATGAVRRTPRGDEVRLPGGTWVPCGINCYHTLKNATVDFWRRYDVFPQ
jgi:hypothetical protein